jgi:hypothetical protein
MTVFRERGSVHKSGSLIDHTRSCLEFRVAKQREERSWGSGGDVLRAEVEGR